MNNDSLAWMYLRMCVAVMLCATYPALAEIPRTMSYQGYITDAGGGPKTGTLSMVFKLYSVSSGGSSLWSETQPAVPVSNGVFDVVLGSVTPLTVLFDKPYYLGVTIAPDTAEMTPRRPLSSSPYSLMAANVSTPTYANWTPIGETNFPRTGGSDGWRYLWLAKTQGTTLLLKVCAVYQGGAPSVTTCYASTALPEPGASGPWVHAFTDGSHPLLSSSGVPLAVAWFTSGGTNLVNCWVSGPFAGYTPTCNPVAAIGN